VFHYCPSLTSVTLGTSVTSIGRYAFYYCYRLTSVTIPSSVTSIGDGAFYACASLTAITVDALNSSYSSVDGVLFNANQTTLILYPVDKYDSSYTIPGSVTSIGNYAFAYCPYLASVTIPNSVTSIGDYAFYYCSGLTDLTLGTSVTSIGDSAFLYCYRLTSVTFPSSVTSIGNSAFYYCSGLKTVFFLGNAPGAGTDSTVFSNDNAATIYYLPGTTGWGLTFDGLPTALWFLPNPQILNQSPSFGVKSNQFGFTISWATNISVVVEGCTNLVNPVWTPVTTNALVNGTNYFSDRRWTNYPGRFYRLRAP